MAKLEQKTQNQMPAGIFNGIEAFWYENEKWVIANGEVKRFHECDSSIQQPIWRAFMADKQSLAYIAKLGITKSSEVFETWYRCVVGGLDHVPDFLNGKFTPDFFNNTCPDLACPHRGRLCSRAAGLKNFEVETLKALKSASNMKAAAEMVHVSLPAMKSRISKLHEKFNVSNSVALMARANEIGI